MKTKYALFFALLMLSGCGDKNEESATQEVTNIEKATQEMAKGDIESLKNAGETLAKEVGQFTSDELKKATPMTNEQLKALLPDTLDGMERKSFHVGQMGMHTVEGTYKDGDKSISLSVMDGAGEAGSAMVGMIQMGITAGGESEDENGYMKPIEIDGQKGVEKQEKFDNGNRVENSITLIVAQRYMLMLTGNGVEASKLSDIIQKEDFIDKLKDLK